MPQGLLKSCSYDRRKVAAVVDTEVLTARDRASNRPGLPPSQLYKPQNLCPAPLPVYRKNLFKNRSPVDQNYVADFDAVDTLLPKVQQTEDPPAVPCASLGFGCAFSPWSPSPPR